MSCESSVVDSLSPEKWVDVCDMSQLINEFYKAWTAATHMPCKGLRAMLARADTERKCGAQHSRWFTLKVVCIFDANGHKAC